MGGSAPGGGGCGRRRGALHGLLRERAAAGLRGARGRAAGLLFANARFEGGPPEFASALTWEEAEGAGQFRVKDLRGPAAGDEVGLVLELEVRAPTHVSCPLGREQ